MSRAVECPGYSIVAEAAMFAGARSRVITSAVAAAARVSNEDINQSLFGASTAQTADQLFMVLMAFCCSPPWTA